MATTAVSNSQVSCCCQLSVRLISIAWRATCNAWHVEMMYSLYCRRQSWFDVLVPLNIQICVGTMCGQKHNDQQSVRVSP